MPSKYEKPKVYMYECFKSNEIFEEWQRAHRSGSTKITIIDIQPIRTETRVVAHTLLVDTSIFVTYYEGD